VLISLLLAGAGGWLIMKVRPPVVPVEAPETVEPLEPL